MLGENRCFSLVMEAVVMETDAVERVTVDTDVSARGTAEMMGAVAATEVLWLKFKSPFKSCVAFGSGRGDASLGSEIIPPPPPPFTSAESFLLSTATIVSSAADNALLASV